MVLLYMYCCIFNLTVMVMWKIINIVRHCYQVQIINDLIRKCANLLFYFETLCIILNIHKGQPYVAYTIHNTIKLCDRM